MCIRDSIRIDILLLRFPFLFLISVKDVNCLIKVISKHNINCEIAEPLIFDCEGALNTLVSVLGSSHERPDEEKRCTVTLLTQLVRDPLNRQVCQVTLRCVWLTIGDMICVCMRVYVCVCVRACVRACVRPCVRACVRLQNKSALTNNPKNTNRLMNTD